MGLQSDSEEHYIIDNLCQQIVNIIKMIQNSKQQFMARLRCVTKEDLQSLQQFVTQCEHSKNSFQVLWQFLFDESVIKVQQLPKLNQAKLIATKVLDKLILANKAPTLLIDRVNFFWKIIFSGAVQYRFMYHLQRSCIKLLEESNLGTYSTLFSLGLEGMIQLIKSNIFRKEQGQRKSKVIIKTKDSTNLFQIGYKEDNDLNDTYFTLLFLGKCLISVRNHRNHEEYLKKIVSILCKLIRLLRIACQIPRNIDIYDEILELVGRMIEAYLEAKFRDNKLANILSLYEAVEFGSLAIDIYSIYQSRHEGGGACFTCFSAFDPNSTSKILSIKLRAAVIHLRFVQETAQSSQSLSFLQKDEELICSYMTSLICYINSHQKMQQSQQFCTILLKLYFSHFKKYPLLFESIHQVVIQLLLFPLLSLHRNSVILNHANQHSFETIEDCLWGTGESSSAMATEIFSHIMKNSKILYKKVLMQIMAKMDELGEQASVIDLERNKIFELNIQTCFFVLSIMADQLRTDQQFIQHLSNLLINNIQLKLSNLALYLLIVLLEKIKIYSNDHFGSQIANKFDLLLSFSLNKDNKFMKRAILQVIANSSIQFFGWGYFEKIFYDFFNDNIDDKEQLDQHFCILSNVVKFHTNQLEQTHLIKLATVCCNLIRFQLVKIAKEKKASPNTIHIIINSIGLMSQMIRSSNTPLTTDLNQKYSELFLLFRPLKAIFLDQNVLSILCSYLDRSISLEADHNHLVQQITDSYLQDSSCSELYLNIFKKYIRLSKGESNRNRQCIFQKISKSVSSQLATYQSNNQSLDERLAIIEIYLQNFGSSLAQTQIQAISALYLEFITTNPSAIQSKDITSRILNVLLQCNFYVKVPNIINLIYDGCKRQYFYGVQLGLLLKKVHRFIKTSQIVKDHSTYGIILDLLYEIIIKNESYENSFSSRQSKEYEKLFNWCGDNSNLSVERAVKITFNFIVRRKQFIFWKIKEHMTSEAILFFKNLLVFNKEKGDLEKEKRLHLEVQSSQDEQNWTFVRKQIKTDDLVLK